MRDGTKEVSELYDAREQMRNTVKELREQLAAAHARIAKLERCVVLGGDGKPIAVGDTVSPIDSSLMRSSGTRAAVDEKAEVYSTRLFKDGGFVFLKKNGMHEAEKFRKVSSPDSVPEGDK